MVRASADRAVSGLDETNRPSHSLPSGYETKPLERLHHLIHRWRRNEKVPLNVGFRRRHTKSEHVFLDECQILGLTCGRLSGVAALSGTVVGRKVDGQSLSQPLDQERGTINEVNRKPSVGGYRQMSYTLSGNAFRNPFDVQVDAPFLVPSPSAGLAGLIDIGRRSPAFPVTPPYIRISYTAVRRIKWKDSLPPKRLLSVSQPRFHPRGPCGPGAARAA